MSEQGGDVVRLLFIKKNVSDSLCNENGFGGDFIGCRETRKEGFAAVHEKDCTRVS